LNDALHCKGMTVLSLDMLSCSTPCYCVTFQMPQRFFKLALEEVQELLDARSNKPTVTQHYPVDFTRPETYEHLLREGNSEEPDDLQDAAAAMQYPDEATAADAEQAGSGAVLLAWLQRAAAAPGAACKVSWCGVR
jgi:hypothetical protein